MQEHSFSTKRILCSLLSSTTGSVIKQPSLPCKIKNMKNAAWRGDGRFDSMRHSAKFGVYTMFCNTILQEVHFELLQVSSVVRIVKLCFWNGWGWTIFLSWNFFDIRLYRNYFQFVSCFSYVTKYMCLWTIFLGTSRALFSSQFLLSNPPRVKNIMVHSKVGRVVQL